eukprot:IDg13859t1
MQQTRKAISSWMRKGELVVLIDVLFDEQPSTDAIIVDLVAQKAEEEPNRDPSADYEPDPIENYVLSSSESPNERSEQEPAFSLGQHAIANQSSAIP